MHSGDGLIERNFPFDEQSHVDAKNLWLCTVKTSDVQGAGTDANVYICVYGDQVWGLSVYALYVSYVLNTTTLILLNFLYELY